MGPGNVKKMVDEGLTTVAKMYSATIPELQAILGKKTGMMAHENIHKAIDGATLPQLMTATNIFGRGFGDKRFVSIFEVIPDVLTGTFDKTELITKVAGIKGLSTKSATEFVDKLPEFKDFLVETGLTAKLHEAVQKKSVVSGHALSGKKIVMTGFRDKALIAEIEKVGGEMSGSVSKNTFVVLVKDKDEDTGKADQARKLGVPLMTPDEFRATYNL
jgi:NAD-dependent DNA ligase